MSNPRPSAIENCFAWVTTHPRLALVLSLFLLALPLLALPTLQKDVRSDAFLAPDNPALRYKEKIQREFGLNDPIIVAIEDDRPGGVFRVETLQLLRSLTEQIKGLDNINRERVSSLSTERNIRATADEIDIRPFLDPLPQSAAEMAALRNDLAEFPVYLGNLVSEDGKMALIVAELKDESAADETYIDLRTLLVATTVPEGMAIHLAGEGAIAGYLGRYIDSDAMRLNPLAGIIINLTILLAFFRVNPALLSNVIMLASVGVALGTMALFDVAFFVITNALPVILIGISVADAIHVYSEYYSQRARHPQAPVARVVAQTMNRMWRPITLTSITTLCGFLGLYLAAFMPPFKYFGLFAAIGVLAAWIFSLLFLPAAIVLTAPAPGKPFLGGADEAGGDVFGVLITRIGLACLRHAKMTVTLFAAVALAGLWAASQLVVEEDRIDLFHPSEPVYQADKAINRHMDGTNVLYIVIETPAAEGLLEPQNLQQIERLQQFAQTLPNVGGAVSIVDYLKQMNRVLSEQRDGSYTLPADRETIAQYLFVYSALADPTDFEEEIDYDRQTAIVRVNLTAGSYLSIKPVVQELQHYIDANISGDLSATLSGRATLNYYWFRDLGASHVAGMLAALALVWLVSSLLFRSFIAGIYTLIPVAGAVLLVYAAMVALGINLGIGSSMFAAVAIGLGVDFAIHTLDRLRSLYAEFAGDEDRIHRALFRGTGRALLFNFLAIACGFGVLISSNIVSLNQFGSIVVLAVTTSFLASLTLLPALVKLTAPQFITRYREDNTST